MGTKLWLGKIESTVSQLKAYLGRAVPTPTSCSPVPCANAYTTHHPWAAHSYQDISQVKGGDQPSIRDLSSPETLHRKCITVGNRDFEKTNLQSVQWERNQFVL